MFLMARAIGTIVGACPVIFLLSIWSVEPIAEKIGKTKAIIVAVGIGTFLMILFAALSGMQLILLLMYLVASLIVVSILLWHNNCNKTIIAPSEKHEKPKWYHSVWFVLLMLCLAGPLVFFLLWKSPNFSIRARMVLTITVLVVLLLMALEIRATLNQIQILQGSR